MTVIGRYLRLDRVVSLRMPGLLDAPWPPRALCSELPLPPAGLPFVPAADPLVVHL